MGFFELAKERFSVRKFADKPIEKEKMDQILEAGRIAPTAKNKQPQMVYVLQSEDAIAKANELTPCIYGAKTVLLVCYDDKKVWYNRLRPGYNSGEVDATLVGAHMMLEAWELGIGSCWVGVFDDKAVKSAYNLPYDIKPVAMIPIGYAAEDAVPAELHDKSKDMDELVAYL